MTDDAPGIEAPVEEAPAPVKKRLTFDDVIIGLSYVGDNIRDCRIALGSAREHHLEVVEAAAKLVAKLQAERKR